MSPLVAWSAVCWTPWLLVGRWAREANWAWVETVAPMEAWEGCAPGETWEAGEAWEAGSNVIVTLPWFPKQSLWFDRRVQAEYSSLSFCFGESYCREAHLQSRVFEWFVKSNKQAECGSKAECSSRQQLPSAQEQWVVLCWCVQFSIVFWFKQFFSSVVLVVWPVWSSLVPFLSFPHLRPKDGSRPGAISVWSAFW